MRSSSNRGSTRLAITPAAGAVLVGLAALAVCLRATDSGEDSRPRENLLANGGFELHTGAGTIPRGWQVVDENEGYFGWIAPRAQSAVAGVWPRSGQAMAACDTEAMGVDSNGRDDDTPRSAIFQTIAVPAGTRGVFSVYVNDIGSSALGHISAVRLGYTIGSEEIQRLAVPRRAGRSRDAPKRAAAEEAREGAWSRPFFRVSQRLPYHREGIGDWAFASIPVAVPAGEGMARLTLWIGIFDLQNSTELGYWRLDDAAFRIER